MMQLIEDYRADRIAFSGFVDVPEGSLDAGSFQDQAVRTRWYELWLKLVCSAAGRVMTARHAKKMILLP